MVDKTTISNSKIPTFKLWSIKMNADVNALPENHDNVETNRLKTAVNIATTGEIIKAALSDVFVEEVNPTDAEIVRYIVIESNKQ